LPPRWPRRQHRALPRSEPCRCRPRRASSLENGTAGASLVACEMDARVRESTPYLTVRQTNAARFRANVGRAR
jgi:hypothetical protein